MKNDVDFSRIVVDEKIIGVLNFNSMIPVNNAVITKMNLLITPQDTEFCCTSSLAASELYFMCCI